MSWEFYWVRSLSSVWTNIIWKEKYASQADSKNIFPTRFSTINRTRVLNFSNSANSLNESVVRKRYKVYHFIFTEGADKLHRNRHFGLLQIFQTATSEISWAFRCYWLSEKESRLWVHCRHRKDHKCLHWRSTQVKINAEVFEVSKWFAQY